MFEDFKIVDGDIALDSSGNFEESSGKEQDAQSCNIRLNTGLREWKFDQTIGVDYFGVVLVKDPDITLMRADFVLQIESVKGIERVTKIEFTILSDRLLNVLWEGKTVEGEIVGGVL